MCKKKSLLYLIICIIITYHLPYNFIQDELLKRVSEGFSGQLRVLSILKEFYQEPFLIGNPPIGLQVPIDKPQQYQSQASLLSRFQMTKDVSETRTLRHGHLTQLSRLLRRSITKVSKWFHKEEIRKLLSPWQLGRERYLGPSRRLQTGGYDSLKRETQLSSSPAFILSPLA